jgi:uncharacterized protein YkwD
VTAILNVILAGLVVTFTFLAPSPQRLPDPIPAIRARLLAHINEHRRVYGLPPLAYDPLAGRAAQEQAQYMEQTGSMGHEDPAGRSPMQRYEDLGGHPALYGENVAYYGDTVTQVDAAWHAVVRLDAMMMAERPPSDGHRENILSPAYRAVGIGIAIGPNGIYIAEDFVTPQ